MQDRRNLYGIFMGENHSIFYGNCSVFSGLFNWNEMPDKPTPETTTIEQTTQEPTTEPVI